MQHLPLNTFLELLREQQVELKRRTFAEEKKNVKYIRARACLIITRHLHTDFIHSF